MSDAPAKVLTIAGSDSGGAAGLQADLKSFTALGVYGMSVVTAVTAQNSLTVTAVHSLPPDFVGAQLDAVFSDYGAAAVKSGFIGQVELIDVIARKIALYTPNHIVVDPVLVNHKGRAMFAPEVTGAYVNLLFPLAHLVTPNRAEAALLTGRSVQTVAEMTAAARLIRTQGPPHVLITGGREGEEVVDLYYDGRTVQELRSPWLETENTHGSGDTFSAAVAAFLAQGLEMVKAVQQAHHFTVTAVHKAVNWRLGRGHGPVSHLPD